MPAAGAVGILSRIEAEAAAMIARFPVRRIGIGFGGPIDPDIGPDYSQPSDRRLARFSACRMVPANVQGSRAVVGNDCDVAGLAEARFGAGRGRRVVFLCHRRQRHRRRADHRRPDLSRQRNGGRRDRASAAGAACRAARRHGRIDGQRLGHRGRGSIAVGGADAASVSAARRTGAHESARSIAAAADGSRGSDAKNLPPICWPGRTASRSK